MATTFRIDEGGIMDANVGIHTTIPPDVETGEKKNMDVGGILLNLGCVIIIIELVSMLVGMFFSDLSVVTIIKPLRIIFGGQS